MKRFLYTLCQWTWGLPQNLAGGLLWLWFRLRGCPCFRYQGAHGVVWTLRSGSMSLGSFLFLHPSWTPADKALLAHEYGHSIQSLFFGPLYLLTVGLPSILWAGLPVFQRRRRAGELDYYAVYPENQATRLGNRYARKTLSPGELKVRGKKRRK